MATSARLSTMLAHRSREAARRRRDRDLKLEALEPRLALATGLLSTLVSVVRDDNQQSLLAPGSTAVVAEGEQVTASVRLTRKPDSAILVTVASRAPLEVAVPPAPLRFTKDNWNVPQAVSLRSLQDDGRDGDHTLPVTVTAAVARNPQSRATRKVWVDSLDSRVVAAATPVTAAQRGWVNGGGNSGTVQGSYDSVTNRGTAAITLTMPGVKNVRNRLITVHYSVRPDNAVQVESVEGIRASKVRLDATYRRIGVDSGIFGTLTVSNPLLGQSATAMITVAAVPEAVRNLAATATGVGSLLLSWEPPVGGATSYTVTMNNGSTTTTYPATTGTSMPLTGLATTVPSYTFTVTANNASGSGTAATTVFEASGAVVNVGSSPVAILRATDGTFWVANNGSGTIQQVVNVDGVWTAQPAIAVGGGPYALTEGLDGSIWVANYWASGNRVQQLVNVNGTWTVQTTLTSTYRGRPILATATDGAIWLGNPGLSGSGGTTLSSIQRIANTSGAWTIEATVEEYINALVGITAGADGTVWIASTPWDGDGQLQQLVNIDGVWTAQPQSPGIQLGTVKPPVAAKAVTTGLDGSIWATISGGGIQQVAKSSGAWTTQPTIQISSTSSAITTGLDGTIWTVMGGSTGSSIQPIMKVNGTWQAQSAISCSSYASDLAAGVDGSVWIANNWASGGRVQQVITPPSRPLNVTPTVGPGPGQVTLSWLPSLGGGLAVASYTATVSQGGTTQTITTSGTSCTFSGLTLGEASTYFTVTASNFVAAGQAGDVLLAADGTRIDTSNLAMGISTDGTPFTGGGFDGKGNAYSWRALGSSSTLSSYGLTFTIGGPNQPDVACANGQTIAVPQGNYNTLNLAGAAVNGTQYGQLITLNFTDGSTATWQQAFSDWCDTSPPSNFTGQWSLATMYYRNTASGGSDNTTTNLYGYTCALPAGKSLASITLPYNQNLRIFDLQMSNSVEVDLSNEYTSWGIANGQTQVKNDEGFDGKGFYYYSGNLQSEVIWNGVTFTFGPVPTSKAGVNNFVQGKGQTINVPQGDYGWLYLACAGANGDQDNQQLTLTFSDGSTGTWFPSFSDWCNNGDRPPPQLAYNESILTQQMNRVNQVGNVRRETNWVYAYSVQFPAGKTLVSFTLPNNKNVGILAAAMG